MNDRILILDFGSQVTQLIARRVREGGVYCEIHPYTMSTEAIEAFAPKGIILSGGPASVTRDATPRAPDIVFTLGVPVLGICYGMQTMVAQLGGTIVRSEKQEFGRAIMELRETHYLFLDIANRSQVWMSHGDHIHRIPKGFHQIAFTERNLNAVIVDDERRFYGLLFHPEVVHTTMGSTLLKNFTNRICDCSGDWTMSAFRSQAIEKIREQVGTGRVICGLSGGVDSSVAAVLIHEAIGDQLSCVFVDTGLLRSNEAEEVAKLFLDHYNIPLITDDASDLFLNRLEGIEDPEQKRKIIGNGFIALFEYHAVKIGNVEFLAQGTLYPDVIESVSPAGGPSATIKSHHNVGGLPERMNLKLVEPLRELFKDEVRALGRELGLPDSLIDRHPFPGPGLAIRIPGEVTFEKLEILRRADAIYLDEIRKAGLYDEIWQAFAVLLPVRSVGVMGDARSYEYACSLRAVTSTDGMTADAYPFEAAIRARIANRIVNEVRGINRVLFDETSKPPATIEWE